MEINFYGVLQKEIERIVANLLEKTYKLGKNSTILVSTKQEADFFDAKLWSLVSWLPHCKSSEEYQDKCNVVIHDLEEEKKLEIKNNSSCLFLFNSAETTSIDHFEKIYVIFDLNNPIFLKYNRKRWKKWQQQKHSLKFYKQNVDGGFESIQV